MTANSVPAPPYPLHASVLDQLDPEYVAFYNKYIINNQQVQYQPVELSRSSGTLIPGGGPLHPVGSTKDYQVPRTETKGPDVSVRIFTPEGQAPGNGWPLLVYFHGGGWVLGNINTENTVCSNLCARGKTIVVSVDYRLAPENPWPAAVDDAWDVLQWLNTPEIISTLTYDPSKIAIGGSSAGGNLAAIMCQRALVRRVEISNPSYLPFSKQLLIVPVTDNTSSIETSSSYAKFEHTAALPVDKMLWYRNHYLPDPSTWGHPEASPLLWEGEWSKLPPAFIIVGELDILSGEGEKFGEKLKAAGQKSELHVMKGMPHPFLAMDGVLEKGRLTITLLAEELLKTFY